MKKRGFHPVFFVGYFESFRNSRRFSVVPFVTVTEAFTEFCPTPSVRVSKYAPYVLFVSSAPPWRKVFNSIFGDFS